MKTSSSTPGVYTAIYNTFNQSGNYRVVFYAIDAEDALARPKVVEVGLVIRQIYMPVILKQ